MNLLGTADAGELTTEGHQSHSHLSFYGKPTNDWRDVNVGQLKSGHYGAAYFMIWEACEQRTSPLDLH